ncbi:MAG: phosphatidate phosphatase APP1 [Pirellulaceae bacterium]
MLFWVIIIVIIQKDSVTDISPSQKVVLYPTYGYLVEDGSFWRVSISGRAYEPGGVTFRKRLLLGLLKRFMGADIELLESEVFRHRISGFLAKTVRVKQVVVRIGDELFLLPKKTRRNGEFQATFRIPVERVAQWSKDGIQRRMAIPIEVVTPQGHQDVYRSSIQLIPQTGVSVISDIDDTIKETKVTCRRTMLENTFLRDFRLIDGMLECFEKWASDEVAFHYVSSSPWQLFAPLAGLIGDSGLPEGSIHLRSFRIRDHMLRHVMLLRRGGKSAVIRNIIESFQGRRFILVGDSGEKDADIYAGLARKFPDQIQGIYIRQLADRPMVEERCQRSFRRIPGNKWQVFSCPSELPVQLQTIESDEITPCH